LDSSEFVWDRLLTVTISVHARVYYRRGTADKARRDKSDEIATTARIDNNQ